MGVGGQHHAPAALPPAKTRYPLYRRLGRPQGRSGRVRKISPPPGFDPRTVHPVASRYTDCAIPAHGVYINQHNFSVSSLTLRLLSHLEKCCLYWLGRLLCRLWRQSEASWNVKILAFPTNRALVLQHVAKFCADQYLFCRQWNKYCDKFLTCLC